MIDPKIVEEIKLRNPIEDVMAQYADLKRAGSNMVCLCPFHSEKTPSCTVFVARQSFYCFGCGAGGDVINLVRRAEGLDYVEALEYLGKRVGITVVDSDERRPRYDKNRLYEMNKVAARFYRDVLFSRPEGEPGRAYARSRELSDAVVKHFGIGFAPDSYNALSDYLKNLGYTEEEMISCFLAKRSDRGGLYDIFRSRLMFPILDVAGNVIAFSGRRIDAVKEVKYLNSADTPVFFKRKNLFALRFAKNSCADNLILCEGQMDTIALHAAGFENSVATLGTALTQDHARLLTKYTKKVTLCYDSDEAGVRATQKAIRLLGEVGLETAVLQVTGAKDPDEFIKKYGREAFARLLGETRSKFRFSLDSILSKYDMKQADDRVRALDEICRMLAGVYSASERDVYTREIAEELGVSPESIKEDTDRLIARAKRERKKAESEDARRRIAGIGDRVNPDYVSNAGAASTEDQLLGLLLLYEEHRKTVLAHPDLLAEEDFFTAFGKKIFHLILKGEQNGEYSEAALGEKLTVEEASRLEALKMKRVPLRQNGSEVFAAYCAALREEKKKKELESSKVSADDLAGYFAGLNKKINEKGKTEG